jgi:iron complex outermembrane receptor protein
MPVPGRRTRPSRLGRLRRRPPVSFNPLRFVVPSAILGLVLAIAVSNVATAQTTAPPLFGLSLEELMNIDVTSVSKKEQKLWTVGAAVYVITSEDILRSGATGVPDLLRGVPGVHVAQMDANTWAISIRGFTDRYGDKVLVLIDGRVVYTPTSSGVNWDEQDVPLEAIDRIEVIRGPGGTVWGANAVNGVINVITKTAEDTQGILASGAAGSQGTAQGLVQFGDRLGHAGAYRVFGSFANIGNSPSPAGEQLTDSWHKLHAGVRSDWAASPRDRLTVQGDVFRAREHQTIDTLFSNDGFREATITDTIQVDSANALARWTHTRAQGSETTLQAYYDHYHRLDAGLDEDRQTVDLDGQQHIALGGRHDLVWGFDYRLTSNTTTAGYSKAYLPAGRTDNLTSVFVQDEIKLAHSVSLTGGAKLEHNAYTGFEYEPSAQLVWTPTTRQTLWTSAARAIRQPAVADIAIQHDVATFQLDSGGLGLKKIVGDPARVAERVNDLEAGYRARVLPGLSIDVTGFFSAYVHLQTDEPGDPYLAASPAPIHWVYPIVSSDHAHARNHGVEVSATWEPMRRWRLRPGYSFIRMHVAPDPSSQDDTARMIPFDTPTHQLQLHSFLTVTKALQVDSAVYHVGNLLDNGGGPTPSYTRLDTRIGWLAGRGLEISLIGQNLLSATHLEFHDDLMLRTLVARRVLTKLTWRF